MVPTVEADDGNVSVKDQRGRGGKPRPSGFVEGITQHRLENPLRLRGFQFMGFGKGLDPAQSPGFLGIFSNDIKTLTYDLIQSLSLIVFHTPT